MSPTAISGGQDARRLLPLVPALIPAAQRLRSMPRIRRRARRASFCVPDR